MSAAPLLMPAAAAREMPHNIEAEQALLGAVLFDNTAVERLGDQLSATHFYEPLHGRLFAAIEDQIRKGQLAEPIVLAEQFKRDSAFEELGGLRYLVDLVDHAPPASNARDFGRIIHDRALRRELMRLAGDLAEGAATDNTASALEQIETAERALFDIAGDRGTRAGAADFASCIDLAIDMATKAFAREGASAGVATGLVDLDRTLGGLHPSDLIILAGRPSMGKSALAMNIAGSAAQSGVPTGVFSLEMSGEQLALRMAAEAAAVPSDRLRRGDVEFGELRALRDAGAVLRQLPLHIDATGGLSIDQLVTRARRMKRLHGVQLVVVDYLQLVRAPRAQGANRVQEVSEITQALKALAKDLNVPVLALSQLSRKVEERDDKRPHLADLRDSGSIEQDADVVMFIYREAYYKSRCEPREGTAEHEAWQSELDAIGSQAELIIAKQRHGPIRTVKLHFNEELTRFSNAAPSSYPAGLR